MFYDVSEDTILRGGGSLGLFSFCKVMTLYRVNPRQSSRARNRQFSWSKTVEHAKRAKYKPPALRVRGVCYTKKSPFRYNKVVQANL